MNEKLIQQISEKTKKRVPQGLQVNEWIEKYNEIFAKFIIEECIQIIYEQEKIPKEFFYPKSATQHESAIKNYFGVEE